MRADPPLAVRPRIPLDMHPRVALEVSLLPAVQGGRRRVSATWQPARVLIAQVRDGARAYTHHHPIASDIVALPSYAGPASSPPNRDPLPRSEVCISMTLISIIATH